MTNDNIFDSEEFVDAEHRPVTPGFYTSTSSGGVYYIFRRSGKLCLTESCDDTDHVYQMAWYLACKIRRIENPRYEMDRLIDRAIYLERKLKELGF